MVREDKMKSDSDLKREILERSLEVHREALKELDEKSTDPTVKENYLYLLGQIDSAEKELGIQQIDKKAQPKTPLDALDVSGNAYIN